MTFCFQIAAIENSSTSGDAVKIQQLQHKCDDLQKKLDATKPSLPTGEDDRGMLQDSNLFTYLIFSGGARKKSVKFAAEPETVISPSSSTMDPDRVKQLEDALEVAARERQEILEAAEKEIEYHRSIAAELETSMINDFEWKLHEIESEYNRKLKEGGHVHLSDQPQPSTSRRRSPLKAAAAAASSDAAGFDHDLFELKLQQAKNEIVRQKDDELAKMHIQVSSRCLSRALS